MKEYDPNNLPEMAFPFSTPSAQITGMELRDYFAAKALSIVANELKKSGNLYENVYRNGNHIPILLDVAQNAYALADAMIKARG